MFVTTDMAFAAYLLATKKLKFLQILPHGTASADICFDDPANHGQTLEQEFVNGDALVSASAFHYNLRSLRRQIQIAMQRQSAGVSRG